MRTAFGAIYFFKTFLPFMENVVDGIASFAAIVKDGHRFSIHFYGLKRN
jgi:hypothetical protein